MRVDGRAGALMKPLLLAVLKLLAAVFAFVGVLAGCLAVMLMLLRVPVVLVAILLASYIFIILQHLKQKRSR